MKRQEFSFWIRRRTWIFLAILLFPFLSLFILTRSFVLSPIIAISLQSKLGAEVVVSGSSWRWGNGVQLNEVVLKADGIQGLAADVITLENVTVEFDSLLPLFSSDITGIDIESIRIRLAESYQHPGEFNFSKLIDTNSFLLPQLSDSSTTNIQQTSSPQISLQTLTVETGVMQEGEWTLDSSKIFTVTGAVQDETKTILQLVDMNNPLTIKLSISSSPFEVSAEIEDVQLDKSIFSLLPRTARTWCKETQLHGGINALDITWDSGQGIQIEASIEDLKFQLPEEHGVPWAAYRDGVVKRIHGDASLDVKEGKIIYDGQNVLLSGIKGLLMPPQEEKSEPLEFSAEMKIYDFQSVGAQQGGEWMNSMLSDSPFKAKFTINDFNPVEGHPGEVRVPLAAAQMLKIFQLESWNMNAEVSVGRTEFKGEIDVQGKLTIDAKKGKYVDFPYPLKNIRSKITFHQNDIQIVDLKADGSEDAKVGIKGNIHATQDDLLVELNLVAANAPIDGALRDAISEQLATVMDNLINQEAYLQITNLLDESYSSKFELGGELDINLRIVHDSRLDSGVVTTGSIAINDIGIMHKEFPYPVLLREGSVALDEAGLHVQDPPIKIEGYGGGRGYLDGSILFLEDGPAPAIAIKLDGEEVTSTLIGAVIESAGEVNELAAGILGGLGLTSELNMRGTVIGKNDGTIDTSMVIILIDGTSKPNEKLAEALDVTGPFWPEGFEFIEINGELHIDNGVVSMEGVTCKCDDDGFLEASLEINKGDFDLKMRGERLPISPRFADVLPQSSSKKLSSVWRWLEPTGVMDAVIKMSQTEDNSDLHMTIEPKKLNVTGKDRMTELKLIKGSIIVEETNVFFNELKFQLSETEELQGILEIKGEVNGELEAYWDEVAIDSPLTRAIAGIAGGVSAIEYFDSIQPTGKATAKAILTTHGEDKEIIYNIEIVPTALSATFHNRRAVANFNEAENPANNVIRFNNDGMHFDHLLGTLGSGDFSLDGEILFKKNVEGIFDLTWSGPTGDESLFAVLPSVVGDTLIAIDLKDGQSVLPNGKVSFWGSNWDDLTVDFNGDILLDGVSMDVGIPLKKIKGIAQLVGEYNEDKLETLDMSIDFEELSTLGRMITDVEGSLEFVPQDQKFVFREMRGESSSGGVTVRGWIGLDESKEYNIEVLLAGIELATGTGEGIVASLQGELGGLFSIAGKRGEPDSRRGVGKVRVEHGHLEIDPLSLTTMRVLQLALPSATTISGAVIELYINGDQIILEEISLRSNESDITGFMLEGEGTIDFETFQIKARLHPRAGLPIIRDITGAVMDQLYSIDVTGKLLNPKVSVVPLPFLSPQEY